MATDAPCDPGPTTARADTENVLRAFRAPFDKVFGTLSADSVSGWAVLNPRCAAACSRTTVPDSANASLIASRSPKYRSRRSLNRSEPTEAGEPIRWLNVSNPAAAPG